MLDQPDRVGRDRERADGLVVAGVADVEDREALAGPHLRFVVHLGDERAHRVHHVAALGAGRGDDLGRRAVRREHERRARRHLDDVVDEDHALLAEPLDDEPVVHDLVVAVHGRLERSHHPGERLDRHLHARAEAPRLGEEHLLHGPRCRAYGSTCVVEGTGPVSWADARRTRSCRRARIAGASRPGSPPATRSWRVNGEQLRDVIATNSRPTSAARRARASAAAGSSSSSWCEKAGGRAARPRARARGLRPGADVRQPLPVLLHPPAPQGHAAQPLPEGRRLPAVVPLRELHDAHPLHRGRLRAGRHREAEPALREHPRHRSRRAHPAAAQPAGRDEPALARARCSTRASRCTARSSCAPGSTTAPCSTTRCSACSTASRSSRRSASCRSA